jgi:hypothetical protein
VICVTPNEALPGDSNLARPDGLASVPDGSGLPSAADRPAGGQCFRVGPPADLLRRNKRQDYSITSSARASSLGGMSIFNAFAVARLNTSSYLVGSSIFVSGAHKAGSQD